MNVEFPHFFEHFSALAPNYDLVLSDVWGVVHNGVAAFPPACDALRRFREGGGTVILITNAPRAGEAVIRQIGRIGVPRDAFDDIVSSGDVSRAVIKDHPGQNVFHLGPERDVSIFDGLNLRFAPLAEADYVICTGLYDDETQTADDYRPMLETMRTRQLLMVCGNPDVVVERGDKLVYCAGAIADLYGTMGGEVIYAGKPYRPIYDQALRKAQALRDQPVAAERILAIGDSVRTDLKGAHAFGVDFLFVTGGIHAEELGGRDAHPDRAALHDIFVSAGKKPRGVTRRLCW
ncbi:MAG TPA: TIGR01459 family HAD-type hydrolase [Pseudolabrys sp.]|nr:TIGR01459 family HAD-type hydrolase [Pseudolabrys sp.]